MSNGKLVARIRSIRRARSNNGSKRKSTWEFIDGALRHPVTLLILGFVLTGGLGAYIQSRQHDLELERENTANAHIALSRIRQAVRDYTTRELTFGLDHSERVAEAAQDARIKVNDALEEGAYAVLLAFRDSKGNMSVQLKDRFNDLSYYVTSFDFEWLRKAVEDVKPPPPSELGDWTPAFWTKVKLDEKFTAVGMEMADCADRFTFLIESSLSNTRPGNDRLAELGREVKEAPKPAWADASGGLLSPCPRPRTDEEYPRSSEPSTNNSTLQRVIHSHPFLEKLLNLFKNF
jgi:hypothetical protein